MSLDDFLKGIAVFDKGLTDYAVSEAVTDANKQLRELNQSKMKQAEMEAAQNELSQTFALRLGQAGASAAQVQQLSGQLGMTTPQQRELDFRREQLGAQQEMAEERNSASIRAASAKQGLKQEQRLEDITLREAKNFQSQNSNQIETIEKVDALASNLRANPKRLASIEMGKTGLLKIAGEDRLSDADVQRVGFPNSFLGKTYRQALLELQQDPNPQEVEFFLKTMDLLRDKAIKNLRKKGEGFSQSVGKSVKGLDPQNMAERVKERIPFQTSEEKQLQLQLDMLEKAKTQYPDQTKRIDIKIQKLKQQMGQ